MASKTPGEPLMVVALDGEGITREDGSHDYTLLLAHNPKEWPDHPHGKSTYIEKWTAGGLSTRRILHFLCHLHFSPRGRTYPYDALVVAYYFNYDVAKWLRDLSDEERTTLWRSGWVVWRDPLGGPSYYLRYIPSKLFFVGEYEREFGSPPPSQFKWPTAHRLIYDVSGFEQRSFVKAMTEWEVPLPPEVEEMKGKRGTFTEADKDAMLDYCEQECAGLAAYMRKLDAVLQDEHLPLSSWHGGGAIASVMLKRHRVDESVRDPQERPEVMDAIMRAYFGGRNELCRMGVIRDVLDYDIHSAYPSACADVPDTVHGRWIYKGRDAVAPHLWKHALWRVKWSIPDARIGPFPYRFGTGVYFPTAGEGWYHGCEVRAALRHYDERLIVVPEGWVWVPDDETTYPLDWVRDYAVKRVRYKASDPKRATIYKYGLNSLYGKFAQHASDPHRPPSFQCYYAAGLITATTRAKLLDFVWQGGDPGDVVMFATDGVFCTRPRGALDAGDLMKSRLGEFGLTGILAEGVYIQPGCWFGADGQTRSRGFGRKSLDYARVRGEWDARGPYGKVTFPETRFVGLGQCAGTGDWTHYGKWITDDRDLSFYPDHKFIGYAGMDRDTFHAAWRHPLESYPLEPYDMLAQGTSAPFRPDQPNDEGPALEHLADLLARWQAQDQPDLP